MRASFVTAQRDRVVASCNVLGAMGRLNADQLSLTAQLYGSDAAFDQVKNKFFGISTRLTGVRQSLHSRCGCACCGPARESDRGISGDRRMSVFWRRRR